MLSGLINKYLAKPFWCKPAGIKQKTQIPLIKFFYTDRYYRTAAENWF